MSLLQKYYNWKNAENPAPITLKNIWAVIQSFYRRNQPAGPPQHIVEQKDRRLILADKKCLSTDVCICGCSLSELVWSDKPCEGGCFGPMLSAKEWKKYKKLNNL